MRIIVLLSLLVSVAMPSAAEVYRYKQIVDEYTTHYAEPPRDSEGNADSTWYEHCTIGDYTYVTVNSPVPPQSSTIEWEKISPPDPIYEQVMACSVHSRLMGSRVERGLYMRPDKHIVPGTDEQVAAWAAAGVQEWGDPTLWTQNPVMTGDQRTHGGKLWESLMDYNVWAPPIGWREVVAGGCPDWVQPTGAHDAYNAGDCVTFEDLEYESVIDANTWSPAVYPAGWQAR